MKATSCRCVELNKCFKGLKEIARTNIVYPSKKNPRIEGLSPEDPAIQELAKSIETRGLQVPPIVRELPDGKFETIDGDRRLLALFDVLGKTSVNAMVWEVEDEAEVGYMRLAANWDRKDFTALEKGAYLWSILESEMKRDGKVPVDEYWRQREIRGEYIRRIASSVAKTPGVVAGVINLWLHVPIPYRDVIARSREELREGKVSPSKATSITIIGRKLGDVEGVWQHFVPKGEPVKVKSSELSVVNRAIKAGQVQTLEQMREFTATRVPEWRQKTILLKAEEEKLAAKLASSADVEVSKIYRAGIHLGKAHMDELKSVVKTL